MRKISFSSGEYYHIFNRGMDKRDIFLNRSDFGRFFQSMQEFNTVEPIGSIYENSFRKDLFGNRVSKNKLVNFICYCLNHNHYHFILKALIDKGVEKFMHRLGLGYTKYFNERYDRSGHLFQGPFKAVHVNSNEYLLHLSVYVNLNNKIHNLLGNSVSKSSWDEYIDETLNAICEKDLILNQFNATISYKEFAESSLLSIKERKELQNLFLE